MSFIIEGELRNQSLKYTFTISFNQFELLNIRYCIMQDNYKTASLLQNKSFKKQMTFMIMAKICAKSKRSTYLDN